MGHGRRREKRSRIDPRRHRQLITQIYVPIVHCLSRPGAVHGPSNHSPPLGRERFDGRPSLSLKEEGEERIARMTASTTRTRKTTTGGPREAKGMRGSVGIGPLPRRGPRADHRCTPSSARFQHPFSLPFLAPFPPSLPEPHPGYRPRPQRAGMRVMLVAHMIRGAFEYPSLLSIAISISFERST